MRIIRWFEFNIKLGDESPEFINDRVLVTLAKDKRSITLIGVDGSQTKFELTKRFGTARMSDDGKYLALMSNDSISVFKGHSLINKFKGAFPEIGGELHLL